MKRFALLCAVAVAVLFSAQSSFAAKKCLLDNFGDYYVIKGGKPDKKSYSVKVIVPGSCIVSGHAEISKLPTGQVTMGMLTSHDLTGAGCLTLLWYVVADPTLINASGSYDQGGNGSVDGAISFSKISCGTVPPGFTGSLKAENSPFIKKAEEK